MNIPFADRLLYRYILSRYHRGNKVASLDSLQLHNVNRVLLVLTTGIGDAVLSTPIFPAVRRALPASDIRLLCREGWQELFSENTNINGIFPYYGKYRRVFKTINVLRNFEPQLTLILHGNDPDIIPLVYLSGSRYIIRIPWKHTRFSFLLSNSERQQDAETVDGAHYIENRLRILETIGIAAVEHTPYLIISNEKRCIIKEKLHNIFGHASKYWIFHIPAANPFKVWSLENAGRLIENTLSILPEHNIILTGSAMDKKILDRLIQGLPPGLPVKRVFNMAGNLSLSETAACISGADFLIGPDTGILYIAAAIEVPVIGLYAPTSANIVGPRSRRARHYIIQKSPTCAPCVWKRCKYNPSLCMAQITVDEVIQGILSVMQKNNEAAIS